MYYQSLVSPPSSKTKQVVIAKYKERTQWVKKVFSAVPFIIYDKYDKSSSHYLPNIPLFPVHAFEGVKHQKTPTGRESHTYLYHIIKNYDSLADMTIFLQGHPVEIHSNALCSLKVLFKKDFHQINFLPLNFPLIICDKKASPLHRGLPLERVFKRLFQGECPDFFAYSWGAMFCVSKEFIHKKPLNFYKEMMQIVYEEPLSGYVYERLWPTILSCDQFVPHLKYPSCDLKSWHLPFL